MKSKNASDGVVARAVIGQGVAFVVMTGVVFLGAGRLDYWQGWLYTLVNAAITAVSISICISRPDLMRERERPGPGTQRWDKIFLALVPPFTIATILVTVLDAGRFRWTGELPSILYVISYLCYIPAVLIVTWAMVTNEFFSSAVRIQKERHQKVVDAGPYRVVRHPGYAGTLIFNMAMPLVLGSLYAVIPALAIVVLLVLRTALEDALLKRELPGYAAYAARVPWRLVPLVW